jgi:hypothetical protein
LIRLTAVPIVDLEAAGPRASKRSWRVSQEAIWITFVINEILSRQFFFSAEKGGGGGFAVSDVDFILGLK